MTKEKLVLLELNEINFDYVERYLKMGISLKGFQSLFDHGIITTSSEEQYELLEPWIQWPSVHTGMTFKEHQVFRLGDIINFNHNQIFFDDSIFPLKDFVTFVAIKNGEHHSKGYAYSSKGLDEYTIKDEDHVSNIHGSIYAFFDDQKKIQSINDRV